MGTAQLLLTLAYLAIDSLEKRTCLLDVVSEFTLDSLVSQYLLSYLIFSHLFPSFSRFIEI